MSKEYIKAQTPLPAYFPYPKFLLQMSLSHTARLTYVLLLDRVTLSQKNGWVDAQGRAYVLYPLAGLAADLQSSISSVTRALRELEAARLIERRSNGFSKPNQIFLGVPQTVQKCAIEMAQEQQAQMVIMLQHGKHQAGNYTKHQYPLKGKVYCGYCQKLMKYRVLKKLGPSFNCRFSATAVDSPCKRIPISEELLEHIVRNALTAQIKQAEYVLEILHERERKALICFSALERQEEKLSAEKAEIVKQRVALYEQYADGNMSKEEFIRQRDAYRVQEDEKMEQIQRLRTEKNQAFQPVKRDTDHLQTVMSTVEEAGDVMYLSQNVVETFIDRIEVFNDEHVKIHFTFENVLADYAE